MAKAKWVRTFDKYNPIEWAVKGLDRLVFPNRARKRAEAWQRTSSVEQIQRWIDIQQSRSASLTARRDQARKAALVRGAPFNAWVTPIKELRRTGQVDEAERLLLECIEATEAEARVLGGIVAPWYYHQLAVLYRKEGRSEDELNLLKHFKAQQYGNTVGARKLLDRLARMESAGEA